MEIRKTAVIGSGTMGNGIAHVFAQAGYEVALIDVSRPALDRAMATIAANLDRQVKKGVLSEADRQPVLDRIRCHESIKAGAAGCDLAVEAATESEPLKREIFAALDEAMPDHGVLASNTSSISITRLASATRRKPSVIGMHFMNPVPVMKLVEVIRGYETSDAVTRLVMETARRLGKEPVEVNDYPGFAANRILMPMLNEAIGALHEGVAGVEAIDRVMRLGMAHPMGPLQLADFIGLDVCLSILKVLYEGFGNPRYAPSPLLVNMVASGNLGKKTGRGFYDYSGKEAVVAPPFA
jgi:3-hydroxybutyryl-CoA dehydrogenase